MTRQRRLLAVTAVVGAVVALAATASAASPGTDNFGGRNSLHESLSSYNETPLTLSTTGAGQFRATINDRTQEITYTLSYSSLVGTVTQSHIHLGAQSMSGGIMVFLCSNLGNGPVGTQACPAAPGTITGTLKAVDVIGPAAQGLTAGQFAELVKAIRAGVTYVNVHSTTFPAGEIRAQLNN
jgi:hypothetical protein